MKPAQSLSDASWSTGVFLQGPYMDSLWRDRRTIEIQACWKLSNTWTLRIFPHFCQVSPMSNLIVGSRYAYKVVFWTKLNLQNMLTFINNITTYTVRLYTDTSEKRQQGAHFPNALWEQTKGNNQEHEGTRGLTFLLLDYLSSTSYSTQLKGNQ